MSKILQATCLNGAVKVGTQSVASVTVLNQGTTQSSGLLVLDEDKKTYITSNATDIKTLIESLGAILDKVTLILTGLDGGAPTPGTQTVNITSLTTLKTQLQATKDQLK